MAVSEVTKLITKWLGSGWQLVKLLNSSLNGEGHDGC